MVDVSLCVIALGDARPVPRYHDDPVAKSPVLAVSAQYSAASVALIGA
jgi:hypothetical protein